MAALRQGDGQPESHSRTAQVGFPLFSCDFNRKMQKLPLFPWILIRNEGKTDQVDGFSQAREKALKSVALFMHPHTVVPNDTVIWAGQQSEWVYLINQGSCRVVAGGSTNTATAGMKKSGRGGGGGGGGGRKSSDLPTEDVATRACELAILGRGTYSMLFFTVF